MPLTLTITEGVISKDKEAEVMLQLCQAFLDVQGLSKSEEIIANIIGHVNVVPSGSSYSGLVSAAIAIVEWKVPAFMFTDRDAQRAYVAEATEIIHIASECKHSKNAIWVNVIHAVDGAWGISGMALSSAELAGIEG
jgi:hypothetical protein